jgi:hypothetical protein
MRAIAATILATCLFASIAFAADLSAPAQATGNAAANIGPLAPGKPAGVKQADIEAGGVLLVVGALAIAGGIALLASQTQGHGNNATPSTGTH